MSLILPTRAECEAAEAYHAATCDYLTESDCPLGDLDPGCRFLPEDLEHVRAQDTTEQP